LSRIDLVFGNVDPITINVLYHERKVSNRLDNVKKNKIAKIYFLISLDFVGCATRNDSKILQTSATAFTNRTRCSNGMYLKVTKFAKGQIIQFAFN
jgi:hypothetical protein